MTGAWFPAGTVPEPFLSALAPGPLTLGWPMVAWGRGPHLSGKSSGLEQGCPGESVPGCPPSLRLELPQGCASAPSSTITAHTPLASPPASLPRQSGSHSDPTQGRSGPGHQGPTAPALPRTWQHPRMDPQVFGKSSLLWAPATSCLMAAPSQPLPDPPPPRLRLCVCLPSRSPGSLSHHRGHFQDAWF